MAKSKGVLLVVGVVVAAGIAYVAVNGPGGPIEGVEGTMAPAERHQADKTRYYQELNNHKKTETIEALARIDVKFENTPAEAEKMLKENGWSKENFDDLVETVRSDSETSKLFEAARKKALQLENMASQQ